MKNKLKKIDNYTTLVIHSTDNSFGFGYRNNNLSDELFITALDATKISGTEVPKPIITIPIIMGEILSFLAKPLEPLTR